MSRFGVISDSDGVSAPVRPDPAGAGRRWARPALPRLPLPLIGMLIYAGIRVAGVALTAVALRHGNFLIVHWSLMRWLGSAGGGHYLAIAAPGHTSPAGPLGPSPGFFCV